MAHDFLSPQVFANAGLRLLKNNLVMARLCDAEAVNKVFKPGGGATVQVKRGDVEIPVVIDKQAGVDVPFTVEDDLTDEAALLAAKVLDASMRQIALYIDQQIEKAVKAEVGDSVLKRVVLVSAKLVRPYSGEAEFSTDPETGITVRYWRYSNGEDDTFNHRWDVMFGVACADRIAV